MNRGRRWVFDSLAAASLLLSAAAGVFWARSYRGVDYLYYLHQPTGCWGLWSRHGRLDYWQSPQWVAVGGGAGFYAAAGPPDADPYGADPTVALRFLGFRVGRPTPPAGITLIGVPYWFLTPGFLAVPAAWAVRRRRGQDRGRGFPLAPAAAGEMDRRPAGH